MTSDTEHLFHVFIGHLYMSLEEMSIQIICLFLNNYLVFFLLNKVFIIILAIIILQKAMAPHSSSLAWKIPWTEEPDGLQFMGSLRVGHN